MKFMKMKKFFIVCFATLGIIVIVFIVNIGSDQLPITENNVRTQLEQMYDAEVAEVKKNEDVYEAIIAKSGQVYLVEMNASTGDVNSLEHTDEFIIQEVPLEPSVTYEEIENDHKENSKTLKDSTKVEIVESHIISSNGTTKLVIIEKPKGTSSNIKVVENPNIAEKKNSKQTSVAKDTKAEEKPMKEVFKDAIKGVLATENTKTVEIVKEETKKDLKTEVTNKTEVPKTETAKAEVSKTDSSKTEASKSDLEKSEQATTKPIRTEAEKSETSKSETTVKTEVSKTEPSKTVVQQKPETNEVTVTKTEEKKTEVTEKPVTVLITVDEALKIANQQLKGIVESNSFVKTNEGGYYLIVMTASKTEETKDANAKDKKTKATIQVHAISGKILSVTWE